MKLIGNFTGKLLACVTTLVLASFMADAQTFKEGTAKVAQIKGSAKYSADGGVWVPLKAGATLRPGAIIQTAPESTVDLNLGENGPLARITPASTVKIDRLAYAGTGADTVIETRLSVEKGSLIGNVKKLAKASKYEIKTPNGVAGIRGTDYSVNVKSLPNGNYEITFTSITGTLVVVASVNGEIKSVVLNSSESWTVGGDIVKLPPDVLQYLQNQIAQLLQVPIGEVHIPSAPLPEQFVSPTIGGNNGAGEPVLLKSGK